MQLRQIELRKIYLPYVTMFETSSWRQAGSHAIIVRIDAEGETGWGEAPLSDGPWYNEETAVTGWLIMRDTLAPILLHADLDEPEDVLHLLARVRGNRMAIAGLEGAIWDLFSRLQQRPLSEMLGGTQKTIPVGVSVGVQSDIDALLEVVAGHIQAGYQRIKLKIKPGWDIEPVRAVRSAWPDVQLQVDANGSYTLDHSDHIVQLDEFNLLLIEQPLAYDDLLDHAYLQRRLNTPICLDESIISVSHARLALEIEACRIINIKPPRVGGLTAARHIHDIAQEEGIPVWCGGLLETGIGRSINVALASLPNFQLPGDISANNLYYQRDIVQHPFEINADSTLTVPTIPGSGALVDVEYLNAVTVARVGIR